MRPSRHTRALLVVAIVAAFGCEPKRPPDANEPAAAKTDLDSAAPGDPRLPGVTRVDEALDAKLRGRIAKALGESKPRTRHLAENGEPKYVNRLVHESSPYLLQHAFNPVNFFPWGAEALERAKRENKPILLSIGYSTCHWCHVMERESFDDEEIASVMNERFVCIKVDREVRPDLDELYMGAVQMLAGNGGWPMTVVLTPDLEPFFGGTYFPARDGDRGSGKGFLTILKELADSYAQDRERVVDKAKQVSMRLQKQAQPSSPSGVPGPDSIASAASALMRGHDAVRGGFGRAPKFPQPDRIRLLARYHRRTDDAQAREVVLHTLHKMAQGGIRDHVGGGFHRYTVDAAWLIPHFEKMLYDNALLAIAYVEAHQMTGDEELAGVAVETLDYVLREMTSPKGGFYSATDADSPSPHGEDEEGLFFTWTTKELAQALPEDALRVALAYWNVTDEGNFEGRSILHTPRGRDEVAAEVGMARAQLDATIEKARARLYAERAKRAPPHLDDKILAGWNGLMISAFARAALALDRAGYAKAGARAAQFVLKEMRDDERRLLRSHRDVAGTQTAFLDDHAFFVQALLDLYEATGDATWVREAIALQAQQDARFHDDEQGGYYLTAHDQEQLVAREKPAYDGAVPAGNSAAIENLLRLADITADQAYRARAEGALRAFGTRLGQGGVGLAAMLGALDRQLDVPIEVVVVRGNDDATPLLRELRKAYLPNRSIHVLDEASVASTAEAIPLLTNKVAIRGRTTAYVCERGRCELPTSDAKVFARQLRKVHPLIAQD